MVDFPFDHPPKSRLTGSKGVKLLPLPPERAPEGASATEIMSSGREKPASILILQRGAGGEVGFLLGDFPLSCFKIQQVSSNDLMIACVCICVYRKRACLSEKE